MYKLVSSSVYFIKQPAGSSSIKYAITTERDTEDHYLYIIQLAVYQLSANDTITG
jgi:hypothetical protein